MIRRIGAFTGLLLGSGIGWIGFGSVQGALGLGAAIAASFFGLLSAFRKRPKG